MTIANVTLLTTFDQWRTVTNQLLEIGNNITENNVFRATSNSLSLDISPRINVGETLRVNVTLSNFVTDTSTSNIPTAAAVNTVYNYASIAHARANAVNIAVISAYDQLNVVFDNLNFTNTTSQLAYNKANAANVLAYNSDIRAIAAFGQANTVFDKANAANLLAYSANVNAAIAIANVNYVNTAMQSAYGQINIATANVNYVNTAMQAAFSRANIATANVNYVNTAMQAAFSRANSSVDSVANTSSTFGISGDAVTRSTGIKFINFKESSSVTIDVNTWATNTANVTINARQTLVSNRTAGGVAVTLLKPDTGNIVYMGANSQDVSNTYIPAGVFAAGDTIRLFNYTVGAQTIRPCTSVTIYTGITSIIPTAGVARNVSGYGLATLTCVGSDIFILGAISGNVAN